EIVEGLRTLLKGGKVAPADQESIIVRRALPHGHVAAVLGTLRNIGLDRMLGPPRNRCRDLVIAMIVARLIAPASKLATARMLDPLTASSSLGEGLGLGPVDEDELYVALAWLGEAPPAMEKALVRRRRWPGGHRGVRGRPRRSAHACGPDRQGQEALRARACGAGRRSWHDHAGAPRCRDRPGRARLDHGVARAGHQDAGRAMERETCLADG